VADTVGVGVIGYGYWGVNLARNVAAAPTTRLVGVAETSQGALAKAAADHPQARTWASLAAMLDDADVAAVVLATPAHTHHALALQVIDAGRHVLVEKPLAMTSADAEEVVAAAADRRLTLMVGHTFLYSAPVQRLRELIVSGELGRVQYLSSQRLSLGRIRKDCDALWNFAPHDLSIMCHLLDSYPTSVSATGFDFVQPGIADVCFGTLRFPEGQGAGVQVSWIDPRKTRLLTVVGDEKMAIYNDVSPEQKLWIVDAGVARDRSLGTYTSLGEFQVKTRAGDILIPHLPFTEPLRVELEAFGTACLTGETPVTDGVHGLKVVRVLEAMSRSMSAGGAPVDVPS
jgi:predicted dehydrogenase